MNSSQVLSLMGVAKKAGKITVGHDAVSDSIKKHKSELVIIASDLSSRSKQDMEQLTKKNRVKLSEVKIKMNDMYKAVGNRTGIVSINDKGFAKKMTDILKWLNEFRKDLE